jgi:FecR protein
MKTFIWWLLRCMTGGLLLLAQASYAQAIGQLQFVRGTVEIVQENGMRQPGTRGANVLERDIVQTAADGYAQIRFADNGLMAAGPSTQIRIASYSFTKSQSDNSRFDLIRGALRAVTGLIGQNNRASYQIRTVTAIIGVRGTAGLIEHSDEGTKVTTVEGTYTLTSNRTGETIDVPAGTSAFVGTGDARPRRVSSGATPENDFRRSLDADFQRAAREKVFFSVDEDVEGRKFPVLNVSRALGLFAYAVGGSDDYLFTFLPASNDTASLNRSLGKIQIDDFGVYRYALQLNDKPFSGQYLDLYRGSAELGPGAPGAARTVERGNYGSMLWGRWTDGAVAVPDINVAKGTLTPATVTLQGAQSVHYMVMNATRDMPLNGQASYKAVGATTATSADGKFTGDFLLRYFVADFGLKKVGLGFDVNGAGFMAKVDSNGGQTNLAQSEVSFRGLSQFASTGDLKTVVTPTGNGMAPNCGSACVTRIRGSFGGLQAADAGFFYITYDGNQKPMMSGVAALTSTGISPAPAPAKTMTPSLDITPLSLPRDFQLRILR